MMIKNHIDCIGRNHYEGCYWFFKGLFIITGAATITVIITGLFCADGKLHATANGHKYGTARHLAFFNDIIHRSSSEIDSASIATYNHAVTLFYD